MEKLLESKFLSEFRQTLKLFVQYLSVAFASIPAGILCYALINFGMSQTSSIILSVSFGAVLAIFAWIFIDRRLFQEKLRLRSLYDDRYRLRQEREKLFKEQGNRFLAYRIWFTFSHELSYYRFDSSEMTQMFFDLLSKYFSEKEWNMLRMYVFDCSLEEMSEFFDTTYETVIIDQNRLLYKLRFFYEKITQIENSSARTSPLEDEVSSKLAGRYVKRTLLRHQYSELSKSKLRLENRREDMTFRQYSALTRELERAWEIFVESSSDTQDNDPIDNHTNPF